MESAYEVSLSEDRIVTREGQIIHHPLNGPYRSSSGQDRPSYGHLTFGGHDLDKSALFDDVKVFYLEFYGEPDHLLDREAWADPLRVAILERLSPNSHSWYLSCLGNILNSPIEGDSIAQKLRDESFRTAELNYAVVQSEMPYGFGRGIAPRFFFEAPNHLLANIVPRYWPQAIPTYSIEGYNMPADNISLLYDWNMHPRDEKLFLEVMQQIRIAFYTYPAEHRHFIFLTNKLTLEDMKRLVNIEALQEAAGEIALKEVTPKQE